MNVSPQQILDAQVRADERYEAHEHRGSIQAFYPVEGNNEVLPAPLLQLIAEGMGSNVPVLSGTNKDEMTMFLTGVVTRQLLESEAKRYGGVHLLDEYRRLMPGANDTEIWVAMSTDFTFKIPAVRLAELRAKHGAETWLYQFDWESRAGHLKSTHALEIPFMFNTLNAPGVDVFIGPGEVPQGLADEMHQVWISFIRGQSPAWPSYTPEARAVQHFDEVSSVIAHEDLPSLSVWSDIL
jgi:para-nitrobenzyl esterase